MIFVLKFRRIAHLSIFCNRTLSRAKGFKEDTILSFLREAAHHAQQVEAILLNEYQISQVQIDGLWTYVGHKKVETKE